MQYNPWDNEPHPGPPPHPAPTPIPTPTPTPTPPSPDAGGGNAPPPPTPGPFLGPAPTFVPPTFHTPSADEAFNDPGYQFRLKSGSDALEASAAAKGVLRTGGTLTDLLNYGQNFASSEYGNVFNRALSAYDRRYQSAKDEFAPKLADWQRDWDIYQFQNPSWAQAHQYHPPIIPPFEFSKPVPHDYGL